MTYINKGRHQQTTTRVRLRWSVTVIFIQRVCDIGIYVKRAIAVASYQRYFDAVTVITAGEWIDDKYTRQGTRTRAL